MPIVNGVELCGDFQNGRCTKGTGCRFAHGLNDPRRFQSGSMVSKHEAERRLRDGITAHRTGLPKPLLDMFKPRPEPKHAAPTSHKAYKLPFTAVSQYVDLFAAPGDAEYEPPPPEGAPEGERALRNLEYKHQARLYCETLQEKRERVQQAKDAEAKAKLEEAIAGWDPSKDEKLESDAFKTLFVGRLSYDATESKMRREFEEFGPVKSVKIVTDTEDKPRGYAFVEFEHKNDMKSAYKMADGRKIEGRRIVVDVERGRTVPNWKPRKLGGGLGGESRLPRKKGEKPGRPPIGLGGPPPYAGPGGGGMRGGYDAPPPYRGDRDRDRGGYGGPPPPRGGYHEAPPPGYRGGGGGPPPYSRDDRSRDGDRERDHDRSRSRDHKSRDREGGRRDREERGERSRERERGERSERSRDRDRDRDREGRRDRDRESRRDRDRDGKRGREEGELEDGERGDKRRRD